MSSQTRGASSRSGSSGPSDDDDDREHWRYWNGQRLQDWMADRACEACRFWQESDRAVPGVTIGECRRYPSIFPAFTERLLWPYTLSDQWCGEFRRKP